MTQDPGESARSQESSDLPEPQEPAEPDEPAGRWIEAAVIAAFVALAPVRIIGRLTDLDIPLWVHGVLFVLFTVVIERALRADRKAGTD